MVNKGRRRKRRRPSSSAETVLQTLVSPLIHVYLHLRIDTKDFTTLIKKEKKRNRKKRATLDVSYINISQTHTYILQPPRKDNQITATNGVA